MHKEQHFELFQTCVLAVYCAANISGGHITPSVTIATMVSGHIGVVKGMPVASWLQAGRHAALHWSFECDNVCRHDYLDLLCRCTSTIRLITVSAGFAYMFAQLFGSCFGSLLIVSLDSKHCNLPQHIRPTTSVLPCEVCMQCALCNQQLQYMHAPVARYSGLATSSYLQKCMAKTALSSPSRQSPFSLPVKVYGQNCPQFQGCALLQPRRLFQAYVGLAGRPGS